MKKMTLALAAVSLLALPTFASPAPKLGAGKPKASPKAPVTGGKIGSAPTVAGSRAPVVGGTKTAPKLGIGSSSQNSKFAGGAPEKVGSVCPVTSVIAKLDKGAQSIMAQAEAAGVGGSKCASKLSTVETAKTLVTINAAGLRQLKSEGCSTVKGCSLEKNARVYDAKAAALAIAQGEKQTEGLARLGQADEASCDFNGDLNNGAIRTAALTN